MQTNEVKRLRELEKENARLKRLLTERDLHMDILKELVQKKLVSAEQKRVAARHLVEVREFQERRVCRLLLLARSSLRYQPKLDEPEE